MKKILLSLLSLNLLVNANSECYVNNYKMKCINNQTIYTESNSLNVAFSTNAKVYYSDDAVIVYKQFGKIISVNRTIIGYDYFRKRSTIRANIHVLPINGKHTFELWIKNICIKRFSVNSCDINIKIPNKIITHYYYNWNHLIIK